MGKTATDKNQDPTRNPMWWLCNLELARCHKNDEWKEFILTKLAELGLQREYVEELLLRSAEANISVQGYYREVTYGPYREATQDECDEFLKRNGIAPPLFRSTLVLKRSINKCRL